MFRVYAQPHSGRGKGSRSRRNQGTLNRIGERFARGARNALSRIANTSRSLRNRGGNG